MKTTGKYDATVLQALSQRVPVARFMRQHGFSEPEIKSCQGMLRQIKGRVAPEDESEWRQRKRLVYLNRRRAAIERLETGRSKSESGDVQLIETYDRALASLTSREPECSSEWDVIEFR
jgi:hypothetical protein